ncbi:MAG: hypothetical protein HQK58_03830 [Deltaproteobacteria bacterium]|nr:hypothetical protein [Deltaproteobacteria bacterium]
MGLGHITSLAVESARTVYAGTYGGGVFKTTDGGNSWANTKSGMTNTIVRALAVKPAGTVYAGTHDGVFKTSNGGASWTKIKSVLTNTWVHALAVDSAGTVYAGTLGSLGGWVFAFSRSLSP